MRLQISAAYSQSSFGVARLAGPASKWMAGGQQPVVPNRFAAAFAILGVAAAANAGSPANSPRGDGGAFFERLTALAGEFQQAFKQQRAEHPGISSTNARHIAQYETIMANRGMFPPEGFSIHTELGDGASITTHIPPVGQPPEPPAAKISISIATIMVETGDARATVTAAHLQASYAEWL